MENSVLTAIERFSLLETSRNVTVALSGGADSVSLLYVLFSLRDKLDITLTAAHLNHMIRGEEADRDELFVKNLCESLNIPLSVEKTDVPLYAKEHKLSIEAAAREVRYDFLERVSGGVVATAHTASDNLETLLFNLTRGAALKGLCGIPPKRDIFIRPLILVTRAEVEKYCNRKGLQYVTDSTNLSDEYTRNNIRHNVIPVLKQINPSVELAAVRTAAGLYEDNAFLEEYADKYLEDNQTESGLVIDETENPSVLKRVLKKYSEKTVSGMTLENKHITDIYSMVKVGGRVSLPLNMLGVIKNRKFFITKSDEVFVSNNEYSVDTETRINDLFTKDEKINNLLLNNSLDCDKIMGKSVIRTRHSGDKIRLVGRGCTKPLKKIMSEMKIPEEERDKLPVIADDLGVIWCYGIGVAARCAVDENSERIMIIKTSVSKIL